MYTDRIEATFRKFKLSDSRYIRDEAWLTVEKKENFESVIQRDWIVVLYMNNIIFEKRARKKGEAR